MGISVPEKTASGPKRSSYTEEQGLSLQLKQRHRRFEQELDLEEHDQTQQRLEIQKDTGKIQTIPPLKTKRKMAFHETEMQPKAKVVREESPPPHFSPQTSPLQSPQLSPVGTPMAQSPTHTGMTQDDVDPWDLYDPPISDSSPESYPTKHSPPEDRTAYTQVLARAARFHNLTMHSEPVEDDFLFNTLASTHASYQSLPMLLGMLKHAQQVFQEPVKGRAITQRVEKKYKPPRQTQCFTQQLPPDSMVVGAARKRANSQSSGDAPPPDKESRKFDTAGEKSGIASSQSVAYCQLASPTCPLRQGALGRNARHHPALAQRTPKTCPTSGRRRRGHIKQPNPVCPRLCSYSSTDCQFSSNNLKACMAAKFWVQTRNTTGGIEYAI
ncbi:hypothetical protein NDU88_007481 [Pleurodeles waltl]|uniref:Uncharacterized protein n=1 Tax=Pleurodeles waltl TaxID=8319 RepID=A0AAV7QP92_PLEWA|nr:hypothetical protein NDU88_007481 [Pleurodeles waltl]